jgi:hypothetical protein
MQRAVTPACDHPPAVRAAVLVVIVAVHIDPVPAFVDRTLERIRATTRRRLVDELDDVVQRDVQVKGEGSDGRRSQTGQAVRATDVDARGTTAELEVQRRVGQDDLGELVLCLACSSASSRV